MSEPAASDLDRSTALAWRRFQARLADRIADMVDEDTLVVEVETGEEGDGASARASGVRFACVDDGARVRAEVAGVGRLARTPGEGHDGRERLLHRGWKEPADRRAAVAGQGPDIFLVDLPAGEADRLAWMSVQALRDVLGVPHPAFLVAADLDDGAGDDPGAPTTAVPEALDPAVLDAAVLDAAAATPESYEELCDLVDDALAPLFGRKPDKDDDGDIPVPWGSSLLFVRVEQDAPVVQLFSVVVDGVTDLRRAAFEVNVLNRDRRFLKFVLVEDRVLAQVHLPAWPLVAEHLRSMLTGMSREIDELDDDLVARVGGCRASDRAPSGPATATMPADPGCRGSSDLVLMTLLHLDADPTGAVDPRLAASVCAWDQELIVDLLRRTEEQELAWRKARDLALASGDDARADVCGHELVAWGRTTSLLRRALRLVVDRALGSDPGRGSTYSEQPRS